MPSRIRHWVVDERAALWQWGGRLFLVAFTALGPWLLALWTARQGFLSHTHARLLAYAYIGRELRDWGVALKSGQAPLPPLWAELFPHPIALMGLAAVAASVLALGLLRRLCRREAGFWLCAGYMAVLFTAPAFLYLAGQDVVRSLTLALALAAWGEFVRFTLRESTWSGFLSGLLFAIASLVLYEALFYGLALALAAPLFRRHEIRRWPRAAWPSVAFTFSLTLLFPLAVTLGAWAFLRWLVAGDALFLSQYYTRVLSPVRAWPLWTWNRWAYAFHTLWADWSRTPLFIGSTLLLFLSAPRRLWVPAIAVVTYFLSVSVLGSPYTPDSTQMLWLMIAVMSLPQHLHARQRRWWAGALVVQLLVNAWLWTAPQFWPPLPQHDMACEAWMTLVRTEQMPLAWRLEFAVAQRLAQAPPHSVLLDETLAYRPIALAQSARPFVTSLDPYFAWIARDPRRWVSYILVPDVPAPIPTGALPVWTDPPPDFVADAAWPGWILYRKAQEPSLFDP